MSAAVMFNQRLVFAIAIWRARVFREREQFGLAMKALDGIYRAFRALGPSDAVSPIVNLFYADLASRSLNKGQSFDYCEVALKQLTNNRHEGPALSQYDERYMKFYCKILLAGVSELRDSRAFQLAVSIETTFNTLRMERVAPKIRSMFPMTEELGRELDSYVNEKGEGLEGTGEPET